MIYTSNTKKAMKLMFEKHRNQFDKSGMPYVNHPLHVAESMVDEDSTCVALMHDIVEDTNTTLDDIKKIGFNKNVIDALSVLTHVSNDSYYKYIVKLSYNLIALKVKLADLYHNSDLSRLDEVTDDDLMRVEKYKKCINYLKKQKECLLHNDKNKFKQNVLEFLDEN